MNCPHDANVDSGCVHAALFWNYASLLCSMQAWVVLCACGLEVTWVGSQRVLWVCLTVLSFFLFRACHKCVCGRCCCARHFTCYAGPCRSAPQRAFTSRVCLMCAGVWSVVIGGHFLSRTPACAVVQVAATVAISWAPPAMLLVGCTGFRLEARCWLCSMLMGRTASTLLLFLTVVSEHFAQIACSQV